MAKGQLQGVGAITVWMIIFVALWLTSTVFLVVLYTGQEELKAETERLRQKNEKLVSRQEESSLDITRSARRASEGGPTVVGLLEAARKETAFLASGEESDDAETVRRKRDQMVDTIIADGLVPNADSLTGLSFFESLSTLYKAFEAEHALRAQAEQRLKELEGEVAKLVELNTQQKNDFDARAKNMADGLARAEADHETYRNSRDNAVSDMESGYEERRTQDEDAITAERERNTSLQRDMDELRKRYVAQQEKFGALGLGAGSLSVVRQADGTILTAVPGDEVVYIDLGAKDRLIIGLQFSVYSSETGIPSDGRAKARVEVVSIASKSAECKILSVGVNELIVSGDLVANPIFDAERTLTFLTIGRFDLDHDGEFDPNGPAVVESMVNAWGGRTTDELTAMTDFVIVGSPPRKPRPARDASPEQEQRLARDKRAWDQYQNTLSSARNLSVPAMSQDVFMNFLGYGSKYARR